MSIVRDQKRGMLWSYEESGPMSGLRAVPTFRGLELQGCDTLFESDIDQDPWVQYHATSSLYEERIDAQGLQWAGNIVSAADVLDVICVFRSMNWYGVHKGGYTVLGSFSLADFQGEDFKPSRVRSAESHEMMVIGRFPTSHYLTAPLWSIPFTRGSYATVLPVPRQTP